MRKRSGCRAFRKARLVPFTQWSIIFISFPFQLYHVFFLWIYKFSFVVFKHFTWQIKMAAPCVGPPSFFLVLRFSRWWNPGMWESSDNFSFLLRCYQVSGWNLWSLLWLASGPLDHFPFLGVRADVSPSFQKPGEKKKAEHCPQASSWDGRALPLQVVWGDKTRHCSGRNRSCWDACGWDGISPWPLLTWFSFSTMQIVFSFSRPIQNPLI